MATDTSHMKLTIEQLDAITMVRNNNVSLLTGGPGTGKTTTIKSILKIAKQDGMTVLMAAPSGKAARRMFETTGHQATTIHRLLKATLGINGFEFKHNSEYPLHADLIIIDETSMVDNSLMSSLLRAIKKGTKLLFVGDKDQLPSIGAGAVFRDFLSSDIIPTTTLNIIHRNAGTIVKACHSIKNGGVFIPPDVLDVENGDNYRHIEESNQERIVGIIRMLVGRMADRGYDPLWDVQVLSPLNSRTIMSCDSLNKVLQESLNPNPAIQDYDFRVGDKVINTRNQRIDESRYIVNGDMGTIVSITEKDLIVEFCDPSTLVTLSRVTHDLLLAYACTIHRFQGSEVPVILLPIHKSFGFFFNRSLLYTAMSRSQEILVTIGQFSAIQDAIGRTESSMRNTMLSTKLKALA